MSKDYPQALKPDEKPAAKKNPHWNYRRFPSIEECEQNLFESKDAVLFWERMLGTMKMMNGQRIDSPGDSATLLDDLEE